MPKNRLKKDKFIKSKLYVYSEGTKTELNYLRGYIADKHASSPVLEFIEIKDVKQNTPESLVKRIVKDKKSHLKGDRHWVAYDRESEARYSDKLHAQALNLAKAHDIDVALSNVCIELWLLIHMVYHTAPYQNCDDIVKNSPLKKELKKLGIDDYDKADDRLYDVLSNKVDAAKARAIKMNHASQSSAPCGISQPYKLNPYTDFHKLLDAIDAFLAPAKKQHRSK